LLLLFALRFLKRVDLVGKLANLRILLLCGSQELLESGLELLDAKFVLLLKGLLAQFHLLHRLLMHVEAFLLFVQLCHQVMHSRCLRLTPWRLEGGERSILI